MITNLDEQVVPVIQRALAEDIGDGDVTTVSTVPPDTFYVGKMIAKAAGIVAGLSVARLTFDLVAAAQGVEGQVEFNTAVQEGEAVTRGTVIATVRGPGQVLLTAERTALNFLQRMSGIATLTAQYVAAVYGSKAKILDTRKTVPGLRLLDKAAVALGGGTNHRHGLYDMVMIKDNHADFAGGIAQAVLGAQRYLGENGLALPIEVETRDLGEVKLALSVPGIQRIMLDNFRIEDLRVAVRLIGDACETEASGGITLTTARAVAGTGVDFLSVGALTHSAGSLDLSLKAMI